jgi:hypothetical protein
MYQKPAVQRFGSFRELTQDVLQAGRGDAIVFCAVGDGGDTGEPGDRSPM